MPPRVRPFDLADVRLLDSPFLTARTRSGEYLLSLDSDRLLHSFRVNAGLKPKAPDLWRLGIGGDLGRYPLPGPFARPLSVRRGADVPRDR